MPLADDDVPNKGQRPEVEKAACRGRIAQSRAGRGTRLLRVLEHHAEYRTEGGRFEDIVVDGFDPNY
jgi:hypothetical protein